MGYTLDSDTIRRIPTTYDRTFPRIRSPVLSTLGSNRIIPLQYVVGDLHLTCMYVDGSKVGVSVNPINDPSNVIFHIVALARSHVIVIICFHT
jgi:hypothetical protein